MIIYIYIYNYTTTTTTAAATTTTTTVTTDNTNSHNHMNDDIRYSPAGRCGSSTEAWSAASGTSPIRICNVAY